MATRSTIRRSTRDRLRRSTRRWMRARWSSRRCMRSARTTALPARPRRSATRGSWTSFEGARVRARRGAFVGSRSARSLAPATASSPRCDTFMKGTGPAVFPDWMSFVRKMKCGYPSVIEDASGARRVEVARSKRQKPRRGVLPVVRSLRRRRSDDVAQGAGDVPWSVASGRGVRSFRSQGGDERLRHAIGALPETHRSSNCSRISRADSPRRLRLASLATPFETLLAPSTRVVHALIELAEALREGLHERADPIVEP